MEAELSHQLDTLQESLSPLEPTVHSTTETSVTLSLTLDAATTGSLVEAVSESDFALTAATYRGVNGRSTVTLEPEHPKRPTGIDTLEERASKATPRGDVDGDTYAFTIFGSNNRVEMHNFLEAAHQCGYTVAALNATTSPPLCIDIHVTPRREEEPQS